MNVHMTVHNCLHNSADLAFWYFTVWPKIPQDLILHYLCSKSDRHPVQAITWKQKFDLTDWN